MRATTKQEKRYRRIVLKPPNATKSGFPSRSQIDDASIVVEKLAAIPSNLHGNTVWIFDILLAQLLQHAAETVVPALLLLGCLAGIRGSELDKQLITYMEKPSQSAYNGGAKNNNQRKW